MIIFIHIEISTYTYTTLNSCQRLFYHHLIEVYYIRFACNTTDCTPVWGGLTQSILPSRSSATQILAKPSWTRKRKVFPLKILLDRYEWLISFCIITSLEIEIDQGRIMNDNDELKHTVLIIESRYILMVGRYCSLFRNEIQTDKMWMIFSDINEL